jgi:hypothetical protein
VTHHLQPVSDDPLPEGIGDVSSGLGEEDAPLRLHRPPWWRWVALAVIVALVIATPLAYALSALAR